MDFAISRGSGDGDYLTVLRRCLSQIDRINFSPDFVLYDAAIDVHGNDKLGLLEMTSEGIFERDKVVLSHFKKKQVPIATTIGVGDMEKHTKRWHSAIASFFELWQNGVCELVVFYNVVTANAAVKFVYLI